MKGLGLFYASGELEVKVNWGWRHGSDGKRAWAHLLSKHSNH